MAERRSIEAAPWEPELFLRFEAERSWPARDLIARIETAPKLIVDLGCGPASSTRELLRRFPDAEVIGVDSSPRMLAEAKRRLPDVEFVEADLTQWIPDRRPDLIFADEPTGNLDSNASAELLGFLKRSVTELGQSIVMVTHDPRGAAYADRVVFLADGAVVAELRQPTADSVLERMRTLGA